MSILRTVIIASNARRAASLSGWLLARSFSQAEDGIRDFHVTGLQTCALPICLGFLTSCQGADFEPALKNLASGDYAAQPRMALSARAIDSDGETRKQWRALNDFVLHKGG